MLKEIVAFALLYCIALCGHRLGHWLHWRRCMRAKRAQEASSLDALSPLSRPVPKVSTNHHALAIGFAVIASPSLSEALKHYVVHFFVSNIMH